MHAPIWPKYVHVAGSPLISNVVRPTASVHGGEAESKRPAVSVTNATLVGWLTDMHGRQVHGRYHIVYMYD